MLLNSLFKADFLANAFDCAILVVDTAVPTHWGYTQIYDPKTDTWSSPGRPKAPKVDARDLTHGWKDYCWGTNIQLEKIGIYALGSLEKLPDGVRLKQSTEVDSIALPQAHVMNNPTELAEPKESSE